MKQEPTCVDYSSTLDCFSFILLFAPDFPVGEVSSIDEVFEDITGGVALLSKAAKNPESLQLFDRCREMLGETLQLYQAGDERAASRLIQEARDVFKEAHKLRNRKPEMPLN